MLIPVSQQNGAGLQPPSADRAALEQGTGYLVTSALPFVNAISMPTLMIIPVK